MGDGGTIPNLGRKQLNLSDNAAVRDLQSIFQIAAVTRPFMSVRKICDEGHEITFNNICAVVRSEDGAELCRFHRGPTGGLYVAKLRLRNPAGVGRQERQRDPRSACHKAHTQIINQRLVSGLLRRGLMRQEALSSCAGRAATRMLSSAWTMTLERNSRHQTRGKGQ